MIDGYIFNDHNEKFYYQYYDNKKQKTIILLHGNTESHEIFIKITHHLKDFNIFLFDTINHGNSSKTRTKLNFSLLADDLLFVINSYHLNNIYLILGYSDGANIMLEILYRKLVLSEKYILVSPNIHYKDLLDKKWLFRYQIKTFFLSLVSFSRKKRADIAVRKLVLKHPKYKISDFTNYSIKISIIVAQNDLVAITPLKHLATLYNAQIHTIENTDHFSLINAQNFIELIKNICEIL